MEGLLSRQLHLVSPLNLRQAMRLQEVVFKVEKMEVKVEMLVTKVVMVVKEVTLEVEEEKEVVICEIRSANKDMELTRDDYLYLETELGDKLLDIDFEEDETIYLVEKFTLIDGGLRFFL